MPSKKNTPVGLKVAVKVAAKTVGTNAGRIISGNGVSHRVPQDIIDKLPPLIDLNKPQINLFDPRRPGRAAVRPDDLLAVRFELVNLQVVGGAQPEVRKTASGDSFIVMHLPPQSITEAVFFEAAAPGLSADVPPAKPDIERPTTPGSSEAVQPAPIRARAAGESRLVFKVPQGFTAPYSIDGLLQACAQLPLQTPDNASAPPPPLSIQPGRLTAAQLAALSTLDKARLSQSVLRNQAMALTLGPDAPALQARSVSATLGVKAQATVGLAGLVGATQLTAPHLRIKPRPAEPKPHQTAIEMPWRLLLSPHSGGRFQHAAGPVTAPRTGRTELWHTRLVTPDPQGRIIQPPWPDARRTVRAVWALTGENSDPQKPMQSAFPGATNLPKTNKPTEPFRTTLSDFDRFQITHLSSNFAFPNYTPQPVDTRLLMLSSLGGWLDARGEWDPPGLDVEEWAHRASMGRDHMVRVVYKGFLFPFGHRAALVKVSERKFHNGKNNTSALSGNPAYLRQRLFLIIRERDRSFVDPQLLKPDGSAFQRQFPFTSIRLLTGTTPNLDDFNSAASKVGGHGQRLFWPCVGGQPFPFRCVGTDIDGRQVEFEMPLLFMSNSMASPRTPQNQPHYAQAQTFAQQAANEWNARIDRHSANLRGQKLALAPSLKSGDTAVDALSLSFGAEWRAQAYGSSPLPGNGLSAYSAGLSRPMFYPSVTAIEARIPAVAQLTGAGGSNQLRWNTHYLKQGFANNAGEVFVNVETGGAQLDFSSQGDRSGGFVMPNISPRALSRSAGPVSVDPAKFISGNNIGGDDFFPGGVSGLPLPLLFGCIPLGAVIGAVAKLGDSPGKVPRFASEAATKLEAFINTLVRAFEVARSLGGEGASLGKATVDVLLGIIDDLLAQVAALAPAQATNVKTALQDLRTAMNTVRGALTAVVPDGSGVNLPATPSMPSLANLPAQIDTVLPKLQALSQALQAAPLPSGFKQSALALVQQATQALEDMKTLVTLVNQAKALHQALDAIVGNPEGLGDLLSQPAQLASKLEDVEQAILDIRQTLSTFRLLSGAPRKTILDVLQAVIDVLDTAGDLLLLLENLLGEELVIRFEWKPTLQSWGFQPNAPLFRANDPHGFSVKVEARVKKSGGSPKISVVCGLKHFDLVLINPAAFMELNFEKIEFTADTGSKVGVDVVLSDIKFVGPLSFVETLRDLIPLDGFSDPPYLDISPSGIDAGFSQSLPNIAVGMFSISNLSLGAGFTVPFIGQPLSVRFNFCTREQPFNLTVSMFGGGGFFGVTISPNGVQILEAAFEFGASVSMNFGVASGGVEVMAGIYFRMEQDAASLTGYFRLGGHVSVLGLISASLELYLELRYEFETGKAVGSAQLTIEVEVFLFSASVTVRCERKFAGSNGDPTFRDLLGFDPSMSLADELQKIDTTPGQATDYAWREYCEAFA